MFRYQARPPSPALDEATAEQLLDGSPLDDLPEALLPLGELLAAAARPALPHERDGSAAAAAAFVAAHAAAHRTKRRRRGQLVLASALGALGVVASTGTAVAATQGALPEPVQAVAHQALGAVGISVPDIHDGHVGPAGHDDPAGPSGEPKVNLPPSTATDAGVPLATRAAAPREPAGPGAAEPPSTGPVGSGPAAADPGGNGPGGADASEPPPAASLPSVAPADPPGTGDGDQSPGNTGDGDADEGDPDRVGDPPVDTVTPDPEMPSLDKETTPPGLGGVPPGVAKKKAT